MTKEVFSPADDIANLQQLRALGKAAKAKIAPVSEPVEIKNLSCILMHSNKAREFAPLLPWVLNKLADHLHEQEAVVTMAINCPHTHTALKPLLGAILHNYATVNDTAIHFLEPAYALARKSKSVLMHAAKPHLPEALKRLVWSPHDFGNLACLWLDAGGKPDILGEPLKRILESQQGTPGSNNPQQRYHTDLGNHLCGQGFIRLINHPAFQDNQKLSEQTQQFAGKIITASSPDKRSLYVLTAFQENKAMVFWRPSHEYSRQVNVADISALKKEHFPKGFNASDIASAAHDLFRQQQVESPNRNISFLAHQAKKFISSEFC